jgi:hypothetical protein
MFSYEKYEIRLESIGGLGANLVGKLLGQLGAEYMELNAQKLYFFTILMAMLLMVTGVMAQKKEALL